MSCVRIVKEYKIVISGTLPLLESAMNALIHSDDWEPQGAPFKDGDDYAQAAVRVYYGSGEL